MISTLYRSVLGGLLIHPENLNVKLKDGVTFSHDYLDYVDLIDGLEVSMIIWILFSTYQMDLDKLYSVAWAINRLVPHNKIDWRITFEHIAKKSLWNTQERIYEREHGGPPQSDFALFEQPMIIRDIIKYGRLEEQALNDVAAKLEEFELLR